jgi:hypothetical protein
MRTAPAVASNRICGELNRHSLADRDRADAEIRLAVAIPEDLGIGA